MDQPDANAQRPFQFQIKHLLWATAWFAGLCGAMASLGPFGAITYVLLSMFIGGMVSRRHTVLFTCSGVVLLLGLCLIPDCSVVRAPARQAACMNNLKQIALALQKYEAAYGTFPPAYIADASGKRLHSWRVLILPYLDWGTLYDTYRFDEPWDGPNNSKLGGTCLRIFACPANPSAARIPTNTSYVAIVGSHTAWSRAKPLKQADFPDGLANTILVVEVANSGIHWMEPRDLDMAWMAKGINPKTGKGISSLHAHGACVAMADGSARFLDETTTQQVLDALLTRDGGEPVEPERD